VDTTVAAIGDAVVAALEDAGYMHSTIGQIRKSIKWLGVLAEKQDGIYTSGLGAEFASMTTSPRTGRYSAQRHIDYSRLVWLFDSFVLTGTVDLSTRPRGQYRAAPNNPEFSGLLASWSQDMAQRGLARSTQNCFGGLACEYLNFVEADGISSWDAATGSSVLEFVQSLRDRWADSSMWSAVASCRPFLKYTSCTDLLGADSDQAAPRDCSPLHKLAHRRIRNHRLMLINQTVEDPLGCVALLPRSVKIRKQHLIDHRPERIQLREDRAEILRAGGSAAARACRTVLRETRYALASDRIAIL
jgi:hypothetical protein